jgi:hypothetical protein
MAVQIAITAMTRAIFLFDPAACSMCSACSTCSWASAHYS